MDYENRSMLQNEKEEQGSKLGIEFYYIVFIAIIGFASNLLTLCAIPFAAKRKK